MNKSVFYIVLLDIFVAISLVSCSFHHDKKDEVVPYLPPSAPFVVSQIDTDFISEDPSDNCDAEQEEMEEIPEVSFVMSEYQPNTFRYMTDGLFLYQRYRSSDAALAQFEGVTVCGMKKPYHNNVSIPNTIRIPKNDFGVLSGEKKVLRIDGGAFANKDFLTSIELPEHLKSIGEEAFKGCAGLSSISIPNTVEQIGRWAFEDCTGIKTIALPDSLKVMEEGILKNCSGLTSVKLPAGLTEISRSCFSLCESLESIVLPNGLKKIDEHAFYDCISLTSIKIPESVSEICIFAFAYCSNLTAIELNSKETTDIDRKVFWSDFNALLLPISEVTINSPTVGIWFSGMRSLKKVVIGKDVKRIGEGAFHDCPNLEQVLIPEGVTSIGDYAFSYCDSLASITIPQSVIDIGHHVFRDCDNLQDVYNLNPSPQEIHYGLFESSPADDAESCATIHVRPGCGSAYRNDFYWGNLTIVEDAVE